MFTSKKNLIFALLLVLGLLLVATFGEVDAQDTPAIYHGTFGGAPYALEDPNAVSEYKNESYAIQGVGYVSDTEFHTMEAVLISYDGHSTYVTNRGGCIYIQTVINGLQAGDIVEVDNDYLYDEGSGYNSFWNQTPYWVQIGDYEHNSTQTIHNWLIYSEKVGDDEYRIVIGSGEYNLAENFDDLTTTIGHSFKLTREVKVYRGVTLANPTTSTRGYTTSTNEDTSNWGNPIAAGSLDTGGLTIVGVKESYVDDNWAGSDNGDIVDGHIFGQDAFDTIQKAVNGTINGGTVHVAAGTYAEQVTIDKALSLIGPNAGIDPNTETRLDEAVIVFPASPVIDPGSEEFGLINANAAGIAIDGFTLDGKDLLTDVVGINADESDLTVKNNIVKNFDRVGIWSSSYEYVDGSWNYNYYNSGILIENNRVYSDVAGRYTDFSGIYIQGGVGVVQGNYVDNARRGIQIQPYNNSDTTQSVVQGNTVKAYKTPLYFNYTENEAANWLFQANTVEGIPWPVGLTKEPWHGLLVQTFYKGNVAFTGNTVNIGTTDSADVYMFGKIAPLGGSVDLDATYANNTFEKVVVITDGTNIIHDTFYTKIQDAINAASAGDTINVAAGTYYEKDILIDKSLTILGDPGDESAGPGANAPMIDGGGAYGDAFKLDNGVTNVTIKGFEVANFATNDFDGVGNAVSAWVGSTANITIQDNYFHDLEYNGVLVGNDYNSDPAKWDDHTNWLIKANIIEDFGYIGFELTNTSTSIVEDNIIHMGSPYIGAFFSSARRSESGLTVRNNYIDGTPSTSFPIIYIYAYDLEMQSPNLDNVVIEGNTIAATQATPYQVYIRNIGTGTVTNVNIEDNALHSIMNATSQTLDASPNWWGSITGPAAGQVVGDVTYSPWCGDAECSFTVSATPVDNGSYVENGQLVFAGNVSVSGGIEINEPNLTILLKNGTVIQNESPCFAINASNTTIMAESQGGAVCVPTAGSNGIDVEAGLSGIRIINMEIDGSDPTGSGDGIHFAGAITDYQIVDNFIHDLDGDGVEFYGAAAGNTQEIIGNLFQNNNGMAINAGSNTIKAEYNSWGQYAATTITSVDTDPWTHVDLYLTGAPYLNQAILNREITVKVMANLQNVTGAAFELQYDPAKLEIVSATPTSVFDPVPEQTSVLDTSTPGSIKYDGYKGTAVTGEGIELYTVVFNAKVVGEAALSFNPATDQFTMSPPSGSSNYIYAAGLTGATVQVVDPPTITSTDIQGYYLTSEPRDFQVSVSNPLTGGTFVNSIYYVFTVANAALTDLNSLTCMFDGSTNTPISMTQQGSDLVGRVGYGGAGFPMAPDFSTTTTCTADFNTAKNYVFTVDMVDGASTPVDFKLATLTNTAVVYNMPALTSDDLDGPYQATIPQNFTLNVNNLSAMTGVTFEVHFDFPNGTVVKYGSNTYTCGETTGCLIPVTLAAGSNPLAFSVTFPDAFTEDITATLYDTAWDPDRALASLTTPVTAYGNVASITGTFSMQGRVFRGGVPVTLTGPAEFPYGPYTADSTDVLGINWTLSDVAEGIYTITTNQPRYLNVIADLGKTIDVTLKTAITALELKGGNAVWTDNEISLLDAQAVGEAYGQVANVDADVNFSGKVDIFDLALVGGNYTLTSGTAYGTGNTIWIP